jgi:hypothetical protein
MWSSLLVISLMRVEDMMTEVCEDPSIRERRLFDTCLDKIADPEIGFVR